MRLAFGKLLLVIMVAPATFGFLGHDAMDRLGPASAIASNAKPATPAAALEHGHVYVLRGLANIWSRGMDKLGEQLGANGVRWSIHNHRKWKELADEAARQYSSDKNFGPIIIVGHSLGADAGVLMATRLGELGVPVRLMVCFDAVAKQNSVTSLISSNVQEVLNFYDGSVWGKEMMPGKGFKGKIENIDLSDVREIGHLNMDKNPELQARVVALVVETLRETSKRAARN